MFLPSDRAFLVHYSEESKATGPLVEGRVEHIQTGRRARFHSMEELQSFVAGILEEEKMIDHGSRRPGKGSVSPEK